MRPSGVILIISISSLPLIYTPAYICTLINPVRGSEFRRLVLLTNVKKYILPKLYYYRGIEKFMKHHPNILMPIIKLLSVS